MDSIKNGQYVMIKRSDGRIHGALVAKCNQADRYISVEWYERGETKGKEVDLATVLLLNPELLEAQPAEAAAAPASAPLRARIAGGADVAAAAASPAAASAAAVALNVSDSGSSTARRTMNSNLAKLEAEAEAAAVAAAAKAQEEKRAATSNKSRIPERRSITLKEVERLKEQREQRRARQAELKLEEQALMKQDPGNPHWRTLQMIREYQSTLEFDPLLDGQPMEQHRITVCVRKRPLSRKERSRKELDVISVPRKDILMVHEPRTKVDLTKFLEHHKFRFDYAFNADCDNALVYKYTAKPLVQTIFEGGMATCFAYGQTGAGKTHTMGGVFDGKVQDSKNGIYALAAQDVFVTLNGTQYRHLKLCVFASFFEIYSGKVFDLLADKQKLRVLEDGRQQVQVVGLTEQLVESVEDVLKLIQHGNAVRTSGQTSANANSSRSHAVFQLVLRTVGKSKIHGKFSFIDLAGNERGMDTSSADRETRMEGAEINKSLLALKECIRALGRQSAHLPFRVSKLTQVLRDSFIGAKSKTCMIAMISPGLSCCEHTLNTLRYADRVKELLVKEETNDNGNSTN
ncbi:kinesin-like protein Klp10A [Drosophila busckii]|uniref:kinesin-like protein Klp10A n=1 Tax=Drosophila busckii TaxID=30019 RepID=UPI001432A8C4|nr:kinesin-like protein Klp10A [Drosophila busckii]